MGDQTSKAAVSEDEEISSDEDDVESEEENMDSTMMNGMMGKDSESKSVDVDSMFVMKCLTTKHMSD